MDIIYFDSEQYALGLDSRLKEGDLSFKFSTLFVAADKSHGQKSWNVQTDSTTEAVQKAGCGVTGKRRSLHCKSGLIPLLFSLLKSR